LLNRLFEPFGSGLLICHPGGSGEPLTYVIKQATRYLSPLLILGTENRSREASCRPFGPAQLINGRSEQEA
jgi:hypothetical protein